MKQYEVSGMSCAACSARVEKAVGALAGVTACSVSLLTHSMGVEGDASAQDVIAAVEKAGYGAALKGAEAASAPAGADALADRETPVLKRRLIASLGFLLALMYVSMGHGMWGWPLPRFLAGNPVAAGLLQLLLAAIVMVINQKFFVGGFRALLKRSPNMDTLVAMGSGAAFVYSACALFLMAADQQAGDAAGAMARLHGLYFESAAMILTLITVGKMLEARAKGRTTDALKSLMKLAPRTATLVRDGREISVPVEQLKRGDVFALRPGDRVPVDGRVIEGESALNEAALTGESIPVDKRAGDDVSAATINTSGYLRCEATRVGEDTALAQIIKMVSDAAATKAPIAKIADRVSGVFVPAVIGVALITLLVWLLLGRTIGFALARAISVLVISCPCALGLATPVAIMVGSGVGAKQGVLFKTAAALEGAGRLRAVALDKTGTLTTGEPRVTDVLCAPGVDEAALVGMAAALERKSEHPLAKAVLARAKDMPLAEARDFKALPGSGLSATIEGETVCGGNLKFIETVARVPEETRRAAERLAEDGKTPLFFSRGGELAGVIAAADALKSDSAQAVRQLRGMGLRVVMLTGDNARTARAIGAQAGVDEVVAGVMPDGKAEAIRALKKYGRVAMVGDGVNDAPALAAADLGIAIGAGTDVAIDAADVVLMKSRVSDVPAAVRLSRATLKNIRENLFWAFIYNVVGIPLAAGAWISLLGWQLSPMFGAAAMSLSSFCVVSNALRLNLVKIHSDRHDHKMRESKQKREAKTMVKTMRIEGMMCGHCEARVKKCLEAIEGVNEAHVSHGDGTAVLTLSAPVADETLRAAVEAQDYRVLGIQ